MRHSNLHFPALPRQKIRSARLFISAGYQRVDLNSRSSLPKQGHGLDMLGVRFALLVDCRAQSATRLSRHPTITLGDPRAARQTGWTQAPPGTPKPFGQAFCRSAMLFSHWLHHI